MASAQLVQLHLVRRRWSGGTSRAQRRQNLLALGDEPPRSAVAVGGRQRPNNSGNIWDHIEVNYLFENGARGFLGNARFPLPWREQRLHLRHQGPRIAAANASSRMRTASGATRTQPNMYQVEHDEMYASIRDGNPINNGARMCNATMMGIMGRIAGYTGKQVTWDQALNSKQGLFPKDQNWETGKHTPSAGVSRHQGRYCAWLGIVVGYQNHIKIVLEVNLY